jgi:hypothetical protein
VSTPNEGSAGIDVVLTKQTKRAGRIDLVIEAMLQIISGADTLLQPQTTHVLPNWKTSVNYLAENYPVVTLRVGNEDVTERIYGRIMSPTQRGHFVTYAWTAHVWAEKTWQLFQDVDQEDETIPMVRNAADIADNIIDALTSFTGDSTSGIVYFDRITARESEPERGPQRLTRVIIAGFVLVQRPLGPAVPPKQ